MSLTDEQAFGDPGPAAYGPHTFQQTPDGRIVAVPLNDEQAFGPQPPVAPDAPSQQAAPPVNPLQGLQQWNTGFQNSFDHGIQRPYDNIAHWMDELPGVGGFMNQHVTGSGGKTGEQVIAGHHQAYDEALARGVKPSFGGELLGSGLGTAPMMVENPWIGGAISGAVSTEHPDDPMQVALDAGAGAVGGKIGHTVAGAALHALSPALRPAVQTLVDNGVKLTPGQIMGGAAQTIESGLDHMPILGQMIKNARHESVLTFDRGTINNRVLAPIGQRLPDNLPAGYGAVEYAHNALSDAYGRAVAPLTMAADAPFQQGISDAVKQTATLPQTQQNQFMDILREHVIPRFGPGGQLAGPAMQDIDSKLGYLGRQYGKSLDPDQQGLGAAIGSVKETLRDLASRQNPQAAGALDGARAGWANLVRIEKAAGSAGAKEGVFTGAHLFNAAKAADGSVRQGAVGRGQALMQDLASAGQTVLPSTVGDSGTALRGLLEAGVLGMGAHEAGVLNPTTMSLAALLAAPYTKPGLAASRYVLAGSRPGWAKSMADLLQQTAKPFIAGPSGAAGASLADALEAQQRIGGR